MSRVNLVLTYASGKEFFDKPDFWIFANSLSVIQNTDFVVLTDDIPEEAQTRLDSLDVNVRHIPKIQFLFRDRHKAYWDFLNQYGSSYQYILTTDSRDVLFQKDPFDWIAIWKSRFDRINGDKAFLNHFVILTSEGFPLSQSGFATIDNFKFEQNIPEFLRIDTAKQQVVNGGISLGTNRALMAYHFLIWSLMCKTPVPCTDQAAINYVWSFLDDDETYSVSSPFDCFCLTGESVREKVIEPISDGNLLKNPKGETYHIVHQWDRIDCLRNSLAQSGT